MAIPQAQLQTWTHQGATATAVATHRSIRYALETAGTSQVAGRSFEIFLQGSYRSDTNIYADSDVDVVVLSHETYTRDSSRLIAVQQAAEARDFALAPATYPWGDFRRDVLASLRAYYGANMVHAGNKAITVDGGNGRLQADVVPCIDHWVYTSYGVTLAIARTHIDGISFWDQAGNLVVNFPKQHIGNGQGKHGRTNQNYKPVVRMFKNARQHLVGRGLMGPALAPSYFVECLLHNVPDSLFVANEQVAMSGILNWLWGVDKNPFVCQNGLVPLFGAASQQWTMPNADGFIVALNFMWNNWPI